jgi:hypothetical protein
MCESEVDKTSIVEKVTEKNRVERSDDRGSGRREYGIINSQGKELNDH